MKYHILKPGIVNRDDFHKNFRGFLLEIEEAPPKTDILNPKNGGLEDDFPFNCVIFRSLVSFFGVTSITISFFSNHRRG